MRITQGNVFPASILTAIAALVPGAAPGQATELVSTTLAGTDAGALLLDVSADGRYVLFRSDSPDVVAGDTNGESDVFLRDRQTGRTVRVSVSSSGAQANGGSDQFGSVSSDGRYVTFASSASNLVANDTNGTLDVFLRDTVAGVTERVSLAPSGAQADGASSVSFVSDDGRYVLFGSAASNLIIGYGAPKFGAYLRDRVQRSTALVSFAGPTLDCAPTAMTREARVAIFVCNRIYAYWRELPLYGLATVFDSGGKDARPDDISNDGQYITVTTTAALVPSDTNGRNDVYLFDRGTHAFELISVAQDGGTGLGYSDRSTVSDDGRFVAFVSFAGILVPGDTNGTSDVFIRDRQLKVTRRANVSTNGVQANNPTTAARITDDGRMVAFQSQAGNLVPQGVTEFQNVYLNTNPQAASFTLQPRPLVFGDVPVDTTSAGQTLTLTNTGTAGFEIVWIGIAGVDANQFARTRQCPGFLRPAQSCTVTVVFSPQSPGAKVARLVVSGGGMRRSCTLSGTGQ
jgi:Tol biopolymer transport system component